MYLSYFVEEIANFTPIHSLYCPKSEQWTILISVTFEHWLKTYDGIYIVSTWCLRWRIDMIAFQDTNKGWIIDPTIRMESHADQPIEVHNEKCSIYNATISYYKNKYQLKDIVVLGLMVGARGTITSQFVQFCRQFNLDKNFIKEIAISTLRDSITILKNHLYGLKHVWKQ